VDGDAETEWEIELDYADLHAFAEEAVKRGINQASERGSTHKAAPDNIVFPSIRPQGWADADDDRQVKSISATFPIDQRLRP